MPAFFYYSKYLLLYIIMQNLTLKRKITGYYITAFLFKLKIISLCFCFFFKLSEIQKDRYKAKRESKEARFLPVCLKEGFLKGFILFYFFETFSALAKAEASLSIACHS